MSDLYDVDEGLTGNPDEQGPDAVDPPEFPEHLCPHFRPGHYSYDPAKAMDGGLNQMRFELGDTELEPHTGFASAVMSDEEYTAVIEGSGSWREAKIRCVKYLLMLFLYQVDYTIDGLSEKLSDRFDRLKGLLKSLQSGEAAVPVAGGLHPKWGCGPHIFHYGMFTNPRRWQP